jgi:hypothetical protein
MAERGGDFLRRFHVQRRHIDGADQYFLVLEQADQRQRYL